MKRVMPWSDDDDSSGASSSHSDSEHEEGVGLNKSRTGSKSGQSSKGKTSAVKSRQKKGGIADIDVLKQYGYKGGPSVLNMPPPKEVDDKEKDWSWSTGRESRESKEAEESYEEREKTRAAIALGEQLPTAQTQRDKKNISFSQKEKRKRELGQASRGKNYVEEEKRLLRDSGIYSGFDT